MRTATIPAIPLCLLFLVCSTALVSFAYASDGNRLVHLDAAYDPYYVGANTAKLTVPQWAGQTGVEAAVVFAIDDLKDVETFESYLRPIIERLKGIDGRAAVSIMTNNIDPAHPHLQKWLREGLSLETHTRAHACPCLQEGKLAAAKQSFDECVDTMAAIPNSRPVAFRMPCCDSMNSPSPRFFAEIFNKTTPGGNFLALDVSVFQVFTSKDSSLPRDLVGDADGREKFGKYIPLDQGMVNLIEDYPYPYVIGRLCWEVPSLMPSDWDAQHLNKPKSPLTLSDWKAAVDLLVVKQGALAICFHPHGWIGNDAVVELIDHAVSKHPGKVLFLSLREVDALITKNVLGGEPLRAANGQDNGARLLDVNGDGYMDVVVGNEKVRKTRIWSHESGKWEEGDFPVPLVSVDESGARRETGVRFGILRKNSPASVIVRNEQYAGLWRFDGKRWIADPKGLDGLELDGPIMTSEAGLDRGVRLRDLDGDGVCELIVGNERQNGAFAWCENCGWKKLPFALPAGTAVADAQGRDAGLRFVDVDADGRDDVVFSNAERYSLHLFSSPTDGWSRRILQSNRAENDEIPTIVRADGTDNGTWFSRQHMWVQNEDTGAKLPNQVDGRSYAQLLQGNPKSQAGSPK